MKKQKMLCLLVVTVLLFVLMIGCGTKAKEIAQTDQKPVSIPEEITQEIPEGAAEETEEQKELAEQESKIDYSGYSAYYDVLAQIVNKYSPDSWNSEHRDDRGKLIDIDNNGVEELVIRYEENYQLVGEIWTMYENQAKCIFKETIAYFAGSGPDGSMSIGVVDGEEYLVVYSLYGETFDLFDEWTLYQLTEQGYSKKHSHRIHYIRSDSAGNDTDTPAPIEYMIDDNVVSEEEFLSKTIENERQIISWQHSAEELNDDSIRLLELTQELMPDGQQSPTPSETISSDAEHSISISEEEAYQIACDYWDWTLSESENDEHNSNCSEGADSELYLFYDGLYEETDGKQYYNFQMRWKVPGEIRLSTVDFLYIDAETGECFSSLLNE